MKKYVFKPYSSTFPKLFEAERKRILSHVKGVQTLEHVGSTAVPGLGGKGIIDMALAAPKREFEAVKAQLVSLQYQFRPEFSTPDRFYFITFLPDSEEGERRYHIHMMDPSSQEWKEMLGFRDYLIAHPHVAQEYARLKKEAAALVHENGKEYRKLKDPFFKKILKNL